MPKRAALRTGHRGSRFPTSSRYSLPAVGDWTFLTNHALVLVCIARERRASMRAMAGCVGITERAVQEIVNDLAEAGYITRRRVGARNVYELNCELPLRHPLVRGAAIGELLSPLVNRAEGGAAQPA